MDTLTDLVFVLGGLAGLILGGSWLVKGAARLASSFGVSDVMIGLTVVAFGTSAPELLVSVSAALRGSGALALGNVVGSNITNIGLILGVTGLIFPIAVHTQLTRREIPLMIGVTLLVFALALNESISRVDGALMVAGFVAFTGVSYVLARRDQRALEPEIAAFDKEAGLIDRDPAHRLRELAMIAAGIALLAGGAHFLVEGASSIARDLGVSEIVIGITLVAFGTSLPELMTSVIAALRRENDIAVGNVVGSNVANLLLILGATALVEPVTVDPALLRFDFVVMLVYAVLLVPFAFDRVLQRREAAAFLLGYAAFTVYLLV